MSVQLTAEQALSRLRDGNQRFVDGKPASHQGAMGAAKLAQAQQPFAIILGCSDSRVPAEMVFDQGLGDLFVIRVAGNVVAPSQVGSVEYAAEAFGTPLVVVLGHSHCGAVSATVNELRQPDENRSKNLAAIVDRVRPAVERLLMESDPDQDETALLERCTQANILASVNNLRSGSHIVDQLCQSGALTIVGAQYALDTGVVSFLSR